MGNTRTRSEHHKEEERESVSINSFRKNDIYSRPFNQSVGRKTLDQTNGKEKDTSMGGLLHRIA